MYHDRTQLRISVKSARLLGLSCLDSETQLDTTYWIRDDISNATPCFGLRRVSIDTPVKTSGCTPSITSSPLQFVSKA